LQAAYNIDASGGAGRVVALVEEGDAPTLDHDLGVYRSQYGLAPCTAASGCLRKLNESGHASPLPPTDAAWAQETSLDVDMVSALCPNCKILVLEATTAAPSDLAATVNAAAALGVVAISNSYGTAEKSSDASALAPAYAHAGIAITAGSGDHGFGVQEPASFGSVIAVGGTTLRQDSSVARGWTETAWNGSGSGCSLYVAKPSWQTDTGCTLRTVADVAFDADLSTGVATYDSTQANGFVGWQIAGGTSIGAPAIAAIYALAGNGVSNASTLYANTSALFDITSGSDGSCTPSYLCTAQRGYDGPTGNGSPDGAGAF
jgi:subtilase family serine protease